MPVPTHDTLDIEKGDMVTAQKAGTITGRVIHINRDDDGHILNVVVETPGDDMDMPVSLSDIDTRAHIQRYTTWIKKLRDNPDLCVRYQTSSMGSDHYGTWSDGQLVFQYSNGTWSFGHNSESFLRDRLHSFPEKLSLVPKEETAFADN